MNHRNNSRQRTLNRKETGAKSNQTIWRLIEKNMAFRVFILTLGLLMSGLVEAKDYTYTSGATTISTLPVFTEVADGLHDLPPRINTQYNNTNWTNSFYNRQLENNITLEIDRSNLLYINTTVTLRVSLTIETDKLVSNVYVTQPNMYKTVDLIYDPSQVAKETDRIVLTYTDVVWSKATVTAIQVIGSGLSYPDPQLPVVQMENKIYAKRIERMTLDALDYGMMSITETDPNINSQNQKIELAWPTKIGAEAYEVEFTFIEVPETRNPSTPPLTLVSLDFRHRATRVRVHDGNALKIPIVLPEGYLVYRVRALGEKLTSNVKGTATIWSLPDQAEIQLSQTNTKNSIKVTSYDSDRNWKRSTVYAEDAKYNFTLEWYDGLLRPRENLTMDQENDLPIVSSKVLDHLGRETVTVMPAPVFDQKGYTFRSNLNQNTSNQPYGYTDFDLDQTNGQLFVGAMSNQSGANYYYSDQFQTYLTSATLDEDVKRRHGFLPKADGYAFAQMELSNDPSARISRSGSVGKMHQLSAYDDNLTFNENHEVVVWEGVPIQEELDKLFAAEVGPAHNYKKVMTKDANGQLSVAYLDLFGRTIATTLAGNPDKTSNLEALGASSTSSNYDIVIDNTISSKIEKKINQTFLVAEKDTWRFYYDFQPLMLSADCDTNFCYECGYDLTISLKDQWGNEAITNGPITKYVGTIEDSAACQTLMRFTAQPNPIKVELEVGEYTLVKTLKFSNKALELNREYYLKQSGCVEPLSVFLADELNRMDITCEISCDQCDVEIGLLEHNRDSIRTWCSLNGVDTMEYTPFIAVKEELDELSAVCVQICEENSPCDLLYRQMLSDVNMGGQYMKHFTLDEYGNIKDKLGDPGFNLNTILGQWLSCNSYPYNWRRPYNADSLTYWYRNVDHTQALIPVLDGYPEVQLSASYVVIDGKNFAKPHQLRYVYDFIKFWRSTWAESLVYLHPEYCYYTKCIDIEPSYEYDARLMETANAVEAQKKGYYNPLGTSNLGQLTGTTISYTQREILGSVERDPILNLPYYTLNGGNFELGLQQFQYALPDGSGGCTNNTNTIWEIYEQYRKDQGVASNMTVQDTCIEDVFWPILRGLYMAEKQKWLIDYYKGACDNGTMCGSNKPLDLIGIARWQGARGMEMLDSVELGWASALGFCDSSDYGDIIEQKVASECSANCDYNVDMWMEWLSGCSKITSLPQTDLDDLKADLKTLCMSGCDFDHIYGSVTRSLANTFNSVAYPFENLHDVFKKHLGTDWFEAGICDDLLIQFPGAYGHDYLATDDPEALDCVCDTVKWRTPTSCPDIVVSELSDTCGCSYPHELAVAKARLRPVHSSEKCQNCIVCIDFNEPAYMFFERYDLALTKITEGDPDYQDLLTTWFNRYFGFNLTYYEYEDFARNCIDPSGDSTLGGLWSAISQLRVVALNDQENFPFLTSPNDVKRTPKAYAAMEGSRANKVETHVFVKDLSPFVRAGFAKKNTPSDWASIEPRTNLLPPGSSTQNSSQVQDIETVKCNCEKILKVGYLVDSGLSGGLPGEQLFGSMFNTWPLGWSSFDDMRKMCCKLWNNLPANDPAPCEPTDYEPGKKFPPAADQNITNELNDPFSIVVPLNEEPCDEEPPVETEQAFLDTCGCKELKQIKDDYDAYLIGATPPPLTIEAFALREKGFAIDNIEALLEACEKMWGTGERKDRDGNVTGQWDVNSNWSSVGGNNLEEYAEDMNWLLNESLLCNPKDPCWDEMPCDKLTFHFYRAIVIAYGSDLIVGGINEGPLVNHLTTPYVMYVDPLNQAGDLFDIIAEVESGGSGLAHEARKALLQIIEDHLNSVFSKCNPNAAYSLDYYLNKIRRCHKRPSCIKDITCDILGQAFKDFLANNPRPDNPGYTETNLKNLATDLAELYDGYNPYNGVITPAVQDMLDWFELMENLFNMKFNKCYNGTDESKRTLGFFVQFAGRCGSPITIESKPKPCPKCYTVDMSYLTAFKDFLDQVTQKDEPNYLHQTYWYLEGNGAFDITSFYNNSILYDNGFSTQLEYLIQHIKVPELVVKVEDQNGYNLTFNLTFPSAHSKWNFGEIVEFIDVQPVESRGCRAPDRFELTAVYRTPKKYWGENPTCPNVVINSTDYCYDTISMLGRFQNVDIGIEVPCLNCARLCNKPFFRPIPDPVRCHDQDVKTAIANAFTRYDSYLKSKIEAFDSLYTSACMNPDSLKEIMRVVYTDRSFHYTLYYYDRSGQLVKTVPPAGIDFANESLQPADRLLLLEDRLAKTKKYRDGTSSTRPLVYHDLVSQYRYNSLGQLVWQKTPDGGIGESWYDVLARPVLMQNAEQTTDEKFNYILYDDLGRSVESGEIDPANPPATGVTPSFAATPSSVTTLLDVTANPANKTEVRSTSFDNASTLGHIVSVFADVGGQQNLRNWVSYSSFEKVNDNDPLTYDQATYYTYDAMGNVHRVVQDIPSLTPLNKNTFTLDYSYDLLSGNIHFVQYQKDEVDQFVHQYQYDGNNRLNEVLTSRDNYSWESDARYDYYFHGPLARMELGELNVQGVDYNYTLQGWLKGVNSPTINPNLDIGHDGETSGTGPNKWVARDAYAFDLSYYHNDYSPIHGGSYGPDTTGSDVSAAYDALYNGNIAMMTTSIANEADYLNGDIVGDVMGNVYRYDQLNRISKHRVFQNINSTQDAWLNTSATGEDLYYEDFQYDGNGNISRLRRNGHLTATKEMDSLTYHYDFRGKSAVVATLTGTATITWDALYSNKLYLVNDKPSYSARYTNDIDDLGMTFSGTPSSINTDNSYGYDELGNMVRDLSAAISEITWTNTGKVQDIKRIAHDPQPDLAFGYDVHDNRLYKTVKPKDASNNYALTDESQWKTEYYIRDEQGNVMATYEQTYLSNSPEYTHQWSINQFTLYGSSRIGVQSLDTLLVDRTFTASITDLELTSRDYNLYPIGVHYVVDSEVSLTERGLKQYELSNHLGNVLATIQDRKQAVDNNTNGTTDYYIPYLVNTQDYYAFGSPMEDRGFEAGSYALADYKYGFQGQEADDEVRGEGNSANYRYRMHDTRIGRFFAVDPLSRVYPFYSPYAFSGNRVIDAYEFEGLEPVVENGVLIGYDVQEGQGPTQIAEDINNPETQAKYGYTLNGEMSWEDIVKKNFTLYENSGEYNGELSDYDINDPGFWDLSIHTNQRLDMPIEKAVQTPVKDAPDSPFEKWGKTMGPSPHSIYVLDYGGNNNSDETVLNNALLDYQENVRYFMDNGLSQDEDYYRENNSWPYYSFIDGYSNEIMNQAQGGTMDYEGDIYSIRYDWSIRGQIYMLGQGGMHEYALIFIHPTIFHDMQIITIQSGIVLRHEYFEKSGKTTKTGAWPRRKATKSYKLTKRIDYFKTEYIYE